jgi:acyl carrier protein
VAYVAAASESAPGTGVLRAFLQEKLPEYMIPSAFVFLDALPRTPNGKVDRAALPRPEMARPDAGASYVAPRNQTEKMLAGIWAEVLDVEQVGINDNFFDLGGHSLRMIRVLRKLQEIVDQDISMIILFQYPTIGSLGNYLGGEAIERSSFEKIHDRADRQAKAIRQRKQMQMVRKRFNG